MRINIGIMKDILNKRVWECYIFAYLVKVMRRNQRRTTCLRLINLDSWRLSTLIFLGRVLFVRVRFSRLTDFGWKIQVLWWLFPYIFLRLSLILGLLQSRLGRLRIVTNFSAKNFALRSPLEIRRLFMIILACDSRRRKSHRFQFFVLRHSWVYSKKETIWDIFNLMMIYFQGWKAISQVFRIWGIPNP
jgi:hypothetical protein